ncbi:hypothetical protein SUGI_0710040 [Cryptomeria japonica]|nr:hypothetical protein SUGI_0710040 [Cryptomeria japonica]
MGKLSEAFLWWATITLFRVSRVARSMPENKENGLYPSKPKELKSNDTICARDTEVKGNFYYQTSGAIPLSRITEAIRDPK